MHIIKKISIKKLFQLFALCVHHYQRQEKLTKDIRKAANEIFTDFLNPSAVSFLTFTYTVISFINPSAVSFLTFTYTVISFINPSAVSYVTFIFKYLGLLIPSAVSF